MKVARVMAVVAVMVCTMGGWSAEAATSEEGVLVAGAYDHPEVKGVDDASPEGKLSLGIELDYASRYIWRGFDLLEDNSPAVQPSAYFEYALTDKLSLGYSIWGNYRLVSNNPNFEGEGNDFDEYDHEVHANYALSDQVGLEFGYIYYHYPSTPSGTDTQEVYAGATATLNDYLSAGFRLNYDIKEADGLYANLKVEVEYPLSETVSLTGSAALGYMDYDNDYYVEGGISDFSDLPMSLGFGFDMGHGLSSFTTVNYSFSLADEINTKDEAWLMAGLAYDF